MMDESAFSPVLVTGAAGFIGASVVRALVERGAAVHAVVREPVRCWRLAGLGRPIPIYAVDLRDRAALANIFRLVRPKSVIHLATHGAFESQSDGRRILETNVLGTYNLLELCTQSNVRVFVNAGSSSEYGFRTEPMRETDRLQPNSFYAAAKAAQTHLVSLMTAGGELAGATLRLFSVYGPWEEPTRLIPTLLRRALAGLPLEMTSPDTARDFVYVDDVVDAMVRLPVLARLHGEVINLGTGQQTTLREVVEVVEEHAGSHLDVRWGAIPARQWDTNCWVADPTLAKSLLGWSSSTSLREGLARTARWMQRTGEHHGLHLEHSAA